jgi:hypothetical protein
MYVVQFPNVVETFQRALNEVLAPFLSSGNTAVLMGDIPVIFYKCDLFYNNDIMRDQVVPNLPFICFVGNRVGTRTTQKCEDHKGFRPYGYEVRQQAPRTVFVGIGRAIEFNPPPYEETGVPRQANMMDAENIWSQLSMVLENKWKDFSDRGIYKPTLAGIPAQVQSKDYFLLTGQLSCEIRYTFTRGN